MNNVVYMNAYKNNFGPQQSYHAFLDTLMRVCAELDIELTRMETEYKDLGDHLDIGNWVKFDALGDQIAGLFTQMTDTYAFLHRTMLGTQQLNSK